MKNILLLLLLFPAVMECSAQSGQVNKETGEYRLISSLGNQYMFYGYAEPKSQSEKLIMFSTFPYDLNQNSSYQLPLGAYHETTSLKDGDKIIYKGRRNGYAEMQFIDAQNKVTTFYLKTGYVNM